MSAGRTDRPCNLKKLQYLWRGGWSCRWSTYYFALLLFSLFNKLMPLHVVDEEEEEGEEEEEEGSGSVGGEAEVVEESVEGDMEVEGIVEEG